MSAHCQWFRFLFSSLVLEAPHTLRKARAMSFMRNCFRGGDWQAFSFLAGRVAQE